MTPNAPRCPVCGSATKQRLQGNYAHPAPDAPWDCTACSKAEAAWAKSNAPLIPSDVAVLLSEDDFEQPQMAVRRVKCDVCNTPAIRVTLPTSSGLIAVIQPHTNCPGHVVEAKPDASIR